MDSQGALGARTALVVDAVLLLDRRRHSTGGASASDDDASVTVG
jgi:hypothetical protein